MQNGPTEPAAALVLDASAMVEALLRSAPGIAVRRRMDAQTVHAPAHLDAEVLSAIGRMHRAGELSASRVLTALGDLANVPIRRHPLQPLLSGAWSRRDQIRLVDALYVELASTLGAIPLLTTDRRLARAVDLAELVGAPGS